MAALDPLGDVGALPEAARIDRAFELLSWAVWINELLPGEAAKLVRVAECMLPDRPLPDAELLARAG